MLKNLVLKDVVFKNLVRGVAASAMAMVLGMGLATSAIAGPPFTVTVAGNIAPATYAALVTSIGTVTFSAGTTFTCSSIRLHDTVNSGTALTTLFQVTASSSSEWPGCKGGPLGTAFTALPSFPSAWTLTGTSGPDASGVTTGILGGIIVHVQDTGASGSLCHFDVSGSVSVQFDNATQNITVLTANSALTTSGVSCLFPVNSTMTFSGSFHITDPSGVDYPIVIS